MSAPRAPRAPRSRLGGSARGAVRPGVGAALGRPWRPAPAPWGPGTYFRTSCGAAGGERRRARGWAGCGAGAGREPPETWASPLHRAPCACSPAPPGAPDRPGDRARPASGPPLCACSWRAGLVRGRVLDAPSDRRRRLLPRPWTARSGSSGPLGARLNTTVALRSRTPEWAIKALDSGGVSRLGVTRQRCRPQGGSYMSRESVLERNACDEVKASPCTPPPPAPPLPQVL